MRTATAVVSLGMLLVGLTTFVLGRAKLREATALLGTAIHYAEEGMRTAEEAKRLVESRECQP